MWIPSFKKLGCASLSMGGPATLHKIRTALSTLRITRRHPCNSTSRSSVCLVSLCEWHVSSAACYALLQIITAHCFAYFCNCTFFLYSSGTQPQTKCWLCTATQQRVIGNAPRPRIMSMDIRTLNSTCVRFCINVCSLNFYLSYWKMGEKYSSISPAYITWQMTCYSTLFWRASVHNS